jgi:hypothetical protein
MAVADRRKTGRWPGAAPSGLRPAGRWVLVGVVLIAVPAGGLILVLVSGGSAALRPLAVPRGLDVTQSANETARTSDSQNGVRRSPTVRRVAVIRAGRTGSTLLGASVGPTPGHQQ